MPFYLNVHSAINKLREKALLQKTFGPSVLITGSINSGKSTLCRILVNYSVKLGWTPLFIDIDL